MISDSKTGGWNASNERMRVTSAGNVGIGTTAPNASALLDLTSTNRGFAPPRMTTGQRSGISSPVNGLIVYDTTLDQMFLRAGGAWTNLNGLTSAQVGALANVVEDTTPQLGGNLDVNGRNITSSAAMRFTTGSSAGHDLQ